MAISYQISLSTGKIVVSILKMLSQKVPSIIMIKRPTTEIRKKQRDHTIESKGEIVVCLSTNLNINSTIQKVEDNRNKNLPEDI